MHDFAQQGLGFSLRAVPFYVGWFFQMNAFKKAVGVVKGLFCRNNAENLWWREIDWLNSQSNLDRFAWGKLEY